MDLVAEVDLGGAGVVGRLWEGRLGGFQGFRNSPATSFSLFMIINWLPFQNVLSIKSLYVFQCHKWSWSCLYLSELRHVYTLSRTLRSSSDTRMLKIRQYERKTHGFCTFSCFGTHIWNSLPQDLRHCSTLSSFSFKAKLKTFLFSQYFRPN